MLQLILGRAGSGKTWELYSRMEQTLREGGRAILLVPEQFSFENERELYLRFGPQLSSQVEVLGFNRLCDNIFRFYGGLAGRTLDDTGRRILMGIALQEVGSALEVYAAQADKPGFIEDMIQEIGELKAAGITPEALAEADFSDTPSLRGKVADIGAIYAAYQALIEESYIDGEDNILRALNLLDPREFFGGVSVFVDSFTAFMAAEYRMLAAILAGAQEVCAAFTCDGLEEREDGLGVFSASRESAARLMRMAQESGGTVAEPLLLGEPRRFLAPELRRLEQGFLQPHPREEVPPAGEALRLVQGADVYDECLYLAAAIAEDVRTRGLRYNEIAVICRDMSPYRIALVRVFQKFGIPFFADLPQSAANTPAITAVAAALACVLEGFTAENVLRFAKCAALGIPLEEAAELENYCYVWNVGSRDWVADFSNHPDGFRDTFTPEDAARLERINTVRRRVIVPLERFRHALAEADGTAFAAGVYQLLEEIGAAEHIRAACADEDADSMTRRLDEQDRVWEEVMRLLDTLATVIGSRRLPLRVYRSLFLSGAAAIEIGSIPQTLDQVIVGTADRIRPRGIRSAYVIGASAGVFPAPARPVGLFGDGERERMIAAGLELSQTAEIQAVREKFYAYFAVTIPSERLWISFPRNSLSGEQNAPSQIITEAAELCCARLRPANSLGLSTVVNAATALESLAAATQEESSRTAALREVVGADFDLQRHLRAAGTHSARLASPAVARRLFGGDMTLSATRIDRFYGCPYSYFCRYGLGIRPRQRAELSPLEMGNVVHEVLEKLLREQGAAGLEEMESTALRREIRRIIDARITAQAVDAAALPKRFHYLYGRLVEQIFRLVRMLAGELAQSAFVPVEFEFPIGEGGARPLRLRTPEGDMVSIEGKVDRIDLYQNGGRSYIRIIDYKTGAKKFALDEVVQGLNMQMFLYLFTLGENGIEGVEHPQEAGVLYMPGSGRFARGERSTAPEKIEAELRSQYRMSGMVLDDLEVIEAMELGVQGRYIPVKLKKDGGYDSSSSIATAAQLGRIKKKLEQNITEMAGLLHQGMIAALPASREGSTPCAYCDYRSVCGREEDWPERQIVRMKNAEVFEKLEEGGQMVWEL